MSAILSDITASYQHATSGWYQYIFPVTQHLFGLLATIEIAWSGILWAIHKNEMESLWVEFLKKMIPIGFFYTLLINAQTWIPDIIQSFMHIGAGASHISALYPSDILDQGISVASTIMQPLLKAGLLHAGIGLIVGGFSALIIIICFALIAAELVVTLVESYIVVSAGILLLGFSANSFTNQYSNKYLSYAMSVGVKLLVLYLIVGVGSTIASNWGALILQDGVKNMTPYMEVLGGALVFLYISRSIPHKAEALLFGTVKTSGTGLAAVSAGAAFISTRAAVSATHSSYEAIKQASMVSQHHGNSITGIAKGVTTAGTNLALSLAGSTSGHYRSLGSAMEYKTKKLDQSLASKQESKVANQDKDKSENK